MEWPRIALRSIRATKLQIRLRDLAANCTRGLQDVSPKIRGRRESRVHAAPAVSRARVVVRCAHEHTGTVGASRLSPRNGFTAYIVLSPATNSSCHRRQRIWLIETRLGRLRLRQLDTSNGCQNHTVLPYAATRVSQKASPGKAPFVCAPLHRSRETRPAMTFAPTLPRPPQPPPTFVTTADAPLAGKDGATHRVDLPDGESGIFFRERLDR